MRPIRRDDIVVIKSDLRWCGDGALLVKRVIAIPGDLVAVAGRSVWINGKWKGSAINHEGRRRAPYGKAVRIPSRHYFVVGDNSAIACDSRTRGLIGRRMIVGKAVLVWSPLDRIRVL